jgi:hypothetical protein
MGRRCRRSATGRSSSVVRHNANFAPQNGKHWKEIANPRGEPIDVLCEWEAMKTILPAPSTAPNAGGSSQPELDGRALRPDELAKFRFFAGLEKETLERIAAHTKYTHFNAGDIIVAQGDAADRFYIIESGHVRIDCNLSDIRLAIEEIGPGDVVGFSWLFMPEKVHFTARAMEPVTAVLVYGTVLRSECAKEPGLGYELAIRTGNVMLERLESIVAMIGGDRVSKKA